jgi:hypothetical protein
MKYLWGLRHLRFVWHRYHCHRFAATMGALGLGLGTPHPHDLAHLDAIWRGEA